LERQKTDQAAENEAIRRGLIYPPPPDFYEKMSEPPTIEPNEIQPQPVPGPPMQPIGGTPAHPNNPARNSWQAAPPAQEQHPPAGYPLYPQGQNYAGMQAPPFVAGPPPAKKSRKGLFIVLGIIAAFVLLGCGLCAWVGVPLFEQVYSQTYSVEINGTQVVNNYYAALQNKQYAQAYSELSTQGALKNISQAEFTAQAEKQDALYGPVLRYTPGQPDLSNYNGSTISTFSITVDVARNKRSYTAQLQLTKVNNQWKISDFDQL
jgi:hypothetical protein